MYLIYLLNTYLTRLKWIETQLIWSQYLLRIKKIERQYPIQFVEFQKRWLLLQLDPCPSSPRLLRIRQSLQPNTSSCSY